MKVNSVKIAAGIVLFNPDDMSRTIACLSSISAQLERIYIFDNSTEPTDQMNLENVVYLTENRNTGIAHAMNRIMEQAESDGYEWVVTMDQDSILPDGLIAAYADTIQKTERLGIVCPQVIDSRRAYMELKKEPDEEFVDFCITSASCTSVEVWRRIGKFDEWLFIDLVDNEFCKRLTVSGYSILRLNKMVLNQEFGKIVPKSPRQQKFWIKVSKFLRNQNFAKFSYKKYVSPMRVYYTNRNIIYVNRKMKEYGPVAYRDNYNCNGYPGFLISFVLPSLLRAQHKGKVLKAIITGVYDGLKKKVDPWKC